MGLGKGSAPQPPNPAQVAQQQGVANTSAAIAQSILNNVNQVTPFGSLTYEKTGGEYDSNNTWVPRFTATTTLSPEQQRLFNTQQQISQDTADLANTYVGRIGEATAQPFSFEGMPAAPTYDEQARIAARGRITARQDPIFQRDEEALRTRLTNQGLVPGSEAWNNAMGDFSRAKNDYFLGADAQAGDEAARIFGLQGDSRSRAIQEALLERSQPINEVSALLGTGPGVQLPQFVNTPQTQVQPTDIVGPTYASYQGQLANHQQQQQAQNQLLGSIFGLGGAALGGWGMGGFKSDRRVKRDIRLVGRTFDGQNVYAYRYIDDPRVQIGLMAQEVEKITPAAVYEINGVKHVDYGLALHAVKGHGSAGKGNDLGDPGVAPEALAMGLSDREGFAFVGGEPRHDAAMSISGGFGCAAPGDHQHKEQADSPHRRPPIADMGRVSVACNWGWRNG